MTQESTEKDTQKPKAVDVPEVNDDAAEKDQAVSRLSSEVWSTKAADTSGGNSKEAERVEKGKPFAAAADAQLKEQLDKWAALNHKDGASDPGQLRKFESFLSHINEVIKEKNAESPNKIPEINTERYGKVLSVVEKYQSNQDALQEALKTNNKPELERLLKEQEAIKKQMESKDFRQDLELASQDLSKAFNTMRSGLATSYDGMLKTLVEFGRKIPLEQLPQDLPVGLKGLVVSNEQFKSMVEGGQLRLKERSLGDHELPTAGDLQEINKLLRFTDAATAEINRATLEQQWSLAQAKLSQIDPEIAKKWFPEKVENLTDEQIEKRLAAATPWIQKGQEVQRYAELHHRLNKMISDQFNWPSWMGGIPSKWDASAIENHKDLVSVTKDEKTGKVNIAVRLPETLDRDDKNTESIRQLDDWLKKYKGPVDQVISQIDSSKAENNTIYWGDIKAEMRVDKDGNMLEKGWLDAQGRQVMQEVDGRKYRYNDEGQKEWVPQSEKLTEGEYRLINGRVDWVKPNEVVNDVNLMEFRTDAKEVKGPNGEPLIEIKQVQKLQYAHWASYQGWGWVSDVKTMGANIKAQKIDADQKIAEDKGAVGGRRDGKKGDYLVTLEDGRQQFIDEKSFEKLYRQKDGKPGEYEEKPKTYKPDEWLVVYRTDSGMPQPTLMQAKDVPGFVSSQHKWHWGTKAVTTVVDALMLAGGVAELKAAMVGVQATEAAAGTAARMTTMQVLGKALLTHQGAFGAFHAGLGATGFLGQGIENLGPYGKTFMHARAYAMIADLGYTAIGRPFSPAPFVPTAQQIAGQGFMSRALLNFNHAFNETAVTSLLRLDKAADYLGKFQSLQKVGSYLSPFAAVGKIPGAGAVGRFLADGSIGRFQALGADVFFLSDIGFRQIPGIVNRAHGTDAQRVQQDAALERRWVQSTLPEDRKTPSSFDKQTMMRLEAFKQPLEEAMKLPANDPKRVELSKKLIETVKNDKADARDRMGAAFALVELASSKEGKLPEKIKAGDASIDREMLHKFVDGQRYLQAKEVVAGYQQNLKLHVSAELQTKLDQLGEKATLSFSDKPAERDKAMSDLIAVFNSSSASPEEKMLAASTILFARRHGSDGKLNETVAAGGNTVAAKSLVDFLYNSSQAKQGSGADLKDNPGHIRLQAGDMLLRLDVDRFSIADMNQICLSIVNDKNAPADPAAKERWMQLKMQAMVDPHGMRLGDLYELMRSRVEPEIASMPTNTQQEKEAKGMALAALQGRDSEAIKKALETLRNGDEQRLSSLATYMLYAAESPRPSERVEDVSRLHQSGNTLAFPQDFSKDSQDKWAQAANSEILSKLKAELPGQSGDAFDKISWDKFRAAEQLMAKNPDLKANPELQAEINKALMSMINGDNPGLAAKALPILLNRMQSYQAIFKQMKPEELSPGLKTVRDSLFGSGAVLDTLRENSIDMLKDSATYSTYSTRVENLAKDLQRMREDYAKNREQMSENGRAQVEAQIAEVSQAYANASNSPGELKKALLKSLPDMISLAGNNPMGAATDLNLPILQKTVQELALVSAERPETFSPELRAQAVAILPVLGKDTAAATAVLSKALTEDPSPLVRLAALDSLQKLKPENMQALCLKQLIVEKHPEVARRLREIEFTNRRPDPDSFEYHEKFNQARLELINQAAQSLSGAEAYIKGNADLKYLDGQTLRLQALADLNDIYFNGVGGFFRFVWEGEKGVDADHAKLLDKYAGYMRDSMDALGRKAATDDEALKALVYIGLSNGRPLLKDDRNWGAEMATQKLKEICQNASPERAKQIAWAAQMLMLHQPTMSAKGRQNVLDGVKSLIAKPGQSGFTDAQVSTLLATSLQRELRNTPAKGAKDFAEREKLQTDMLNLLSEPRFRNKEILPALEAISAGTPKFQVQRTPEGAVNKVQYPDGSSREVQQRGGVPSKYVFKDSAGKETVWLAEPGKANTWYKETDKEKKEPWTGSFRFDNASGDYISESGNPPTRTVVKANGGMIESRDGKVSKVTYPDGSSRQFEPPGDNYTRFTFSSADGKTKQVWERDGNTKTFYKSEDKDRKEPWTGEEHVDTASGDLIRLNGQTRTIYKLDGSTQQIKDGVMTELTPASSIAYNTSLDSVRAKAQSLLSLMSDRSDLLRQQAQIPEGFNPAAAAKKISDELANPNASSDKVGRAIALSEKLAPIKDDADPRRAPLQIAARDGHELVRMMAARELAKSSNADDRKLAYSVLARLEKQGTRQGYVSESHELLGQILADSKISAAEKAQIEAARNEANRMDAATYHAQERTSDVAAALDYQDAYERATRDLKEIALRAHRLEQYQGSENWFSKNENYKLLDADKLREAQSQAAKDAYPGPIKWLFMSRESIDKVCDDAVKEVWNRQDRQLAALGEQAKLAGENGRAAREALASIILSQGQPFRESDRRAAMQDAAKMIFDCIKDGHPGSRDMMWAVQAALIEEPALDQTTRLWLINSLVSARNRGIIDNKEASIVMAAALQSEYQGMPGRDKAEARASSLENQKLVIDLIGLWGNVEASPVLEAMAKYHPDAAVKQRAADSLLLLKMNLPARVRDGGAVRNSDAAAGRNLFDDPAKQVQFNQLSEQILELERIRLRLPVGTSAEQIMRARQAESGK